MAFFPQYSTNVRSDLAQAQGYPTNTRTGFQPLNRFGAFAQFQNRRRVAPNWQALAMQRLRHARNPFLPPPFVPPIRADAPLGNAPALLFPDYGLHDGPGFGLDYPTNARTY